MNKLLGDRRASPVRRRPVRFRGAAPFVGREEELRCLASAMALAAEGQGSSVFLTGPSGIGKTRLAREALAQAEIRGFTHLEGRAHPLETGLAYAPILDAFGPLLRSLDPSRLAVLVGGLPDLGRLFAGLRLPPPDPLDDPALEKTRLFEAVMRLLERLAQEAPVALFLDDVHGADPASLELFYHLARGLSDQRVLLLAAYSADTLGTPPALRSLVVSLKRGGLAEEIVIPRLGLDGVNKMAQGLLSDEVPDDLLALLDTRAGGTPLFIETLITGLIDSGSLIRTDLGWNLDAKGTTSLPLSVRQLILERLDRLAAPDRHVLDLIAIMGDATSHAVLQAGSGMGEEALLEALRRLRSAGLVAERTDWEDVTYSITHPLIQEVALAEVPEMARRRAHMVAIETLESFGEGRPDKVDRLARHYRGAGAGADPQRALAALLAAGDRALALYANEEAARHYETALALLRGGQGSGAMGRGDLSTAPRGHPPQPSTLAEVLERLGEAWVRIGQTGRAVEAWNEALTEREGAGEVVEASRLRCRLATVEWSRSQFDTANTHLAAGLGALAGRDPSQELADLLAVRRGLLDHLGDAAGAANAAANLLLVAERLGSPQAEARANLVVADSCLSQGDAARARERALHALLLGEQAQDLGICSRCRSALMRIGARQGEHRLMRYHAERGLAMARRLGAPTIEVFLLVRLAYANFLSGAWDESLGCLMEAIALARRMGHSRDLASSLAQRAMILALQGDLSEADACISEVRLLHGIGIPSDRYIFSLIDIAEAAVALEGGQIERAQAITRAFVGPQGSGPAPSGLRPEWVPIGLMLLAEAQIAAGNPEMALDTAREITALGPTGALYLTALSSRAEGLAQHALGRREAAMACLTKAHEVFTALEIPFEAAKSLLEQATAAAGVRPELAVRAAQQSLAVFERLGAHRHADRARRLLRELGILSPVTRRAYLGGVPLSERELEIARLVANGLTSSEIANRLTLSPRTVTTHLGHIYSRLGIGSRTALARLVIDASLAPSEDENT